MTDPSPAPQAFAPANRPAPFVLPRSIGKLLIESSAIFLSVLLAFVVEQWREERNEFAEAQQALTLVRAELAQNLAELERVVPMREGMLADYLAAMEQLKTQNKFPSQLPEFVSPNITVLAYELATDSGAVTSVQPANLLVIAKAYEALEAVRRNDDFLNARNAQIRFNDGEQYLSGFIYFINRATGNEPVAIERVRDALALLDRTG